LHYENTYFATTAEEQELHLTTIFVLAADAMALASKLSSNRFSLECLLKAKSHVMSVKDAAKSSNEVALTATVIKLWNILRNSLSRLRLAHQKAMKLFSMAKLMRVRTGKLVTLLFE